MVKNLPANAGDVRDMGSIPGLGRSPGIPCILSWKIPRTEEPGGLQSMGSQKSQTPLSDSTTRTNLHDGGMGTG